MQYWWVNHNQTGPEEVEKGLLWSPKNSKTGARIQFYENMRRAAVGDPVLSCVSGGIAHVGVVKEAASTTRKPAAYGPAGENWNDDGWGLPVSWTPLQRPVRPSDHIDQLIQWLPRKYSPIRATGRGNQVYLSEIPEAVFDFIVAEGRGDPEAWKDSGLPIVRTDRRGRVAENRTPFNAPLSDSEVEQKVRARRGQGIFRVRVSKIEENGCRLTGIQNPRLLRASHIKPWRDCTTYERLDGANGLLLTPHVDHLFDNGYISFEDSGGVRVSSRLSAEELDGLGLADARTRNAGAFTEEQQVYLAHHRRHVFKK